MNILCLGDIVGKPGRKAVSDHLAALKEEFSIDAVVANAENAAGGSGITERIANQFFREGCDVLTLGDHAWDRADVLKYLDEAPNIVRPANFPEGSPGHGVCYFKTKSGQTLAVISLVGRVFVKYSTDCPFRKLEALFLEHIRMFRQLMRKSFLLGQRTSQIWGCLVRSIRLSG